MKASCAPYKSIVYHVLKGREVACKVKTVSLEVKTVPLDDKTKALDVKTETSFGILKIYSYLCKQNDKVCMQSISNERCLI